MSSGSRNTIKVQGKKKNCLKRSKYPRLSKSELIFCTIRKLIEITYVRFPKQVLDAILDLENGGLFIDIVKQKYSFNTVAFGKLIRVIRCLKVKNVLHIKSKLQLLNRLILEIDSSFADIAMTQEESVALINKYCKSRRRSLNVEDCIKALRALDNGLSMEAASKLYRLPIVPLYNYAIQLNISNCFTNNEDSKPSISTVTDQELKDTLIKNLNGYYFTSAISHNKNIKKMKSDHKRVPLCQFCHLPGDREVELGKLHSIDDIFVHYYCLLFSSALEQNGKDEEGILGFLPKDITKEINRGSKLKCNYCGIKGATIGCNNKHCKKTYHFPCGLDHFAQYVFTDNFGSMCSKHRKYQVGKGLGEKMECPICMDHLVADPKFTIWAPCCKQPFWFHKICIQKMALNAGYFFRCPLCNDKNIFTNEMLHQGIFVPEKDASWELEPHAYEELLDRHSICDAEKCSCPAGRKSDEEGTQWEVILCNLCGSSGIHIACGKLRLTDTTWCCPSCSVILKEYTLSAKQENRNLRLSIRRMNFKEPESSDEDEDREVKKRRLSSCDKTSSFSTSHDGMQSVAQPSSSSLNDVSLASDSCESNSDYVVIVPKGIRGDVIIKNLIMNGEELSDALTEMKVYAENFPSKLCSVHLNEKELLEILDNCTAYQNQQTFYQINTEHVQRFVDCSYNFDQMRFLRKAFEFCFVIHKLKKTNNKHSKMKRKNPFVGNKLKRRNFYARTKSLEKSLVTLLLKARNVNLLQGNNTWSGYKKDASELTNQKEQEVENIPTTSRASPTKSNCESPTNSARYIRVMVGNSLKENCNWCNMILKPGIHPTTVTLSSGRLEVICTACLTCNVYNDIFPRFKNTGISQSSEPVKSEETPKVKLKKTSCDTPNDVLEKGQSSLYDYFSPLHKKVTPSTPSAETIDSQTTSSSNTEEHVSKKLDSADSDSDNNLSNSEEKNSTSIVTPLDEEKQSEVETKEESEDRLSPVVSAPPEHLPIPLPSRSKSLCRSCTSFFLDNDKSLAKASTIYCSSCENNPNFCCKEHFNIWHSFIHNWMIIPSVEDNINPVKMCKVCDKRNLTRYYCPACPWDVGYCSIEHYNHMHPS